MPDFRKLPVVISAVRFVGTNDGPIFGPGPDEIGFRPQDEQSPDWLREACALPQTEPGALFFRDGELRVMTLEGSIVASKGDWIIRGVQGELYPCKPDIFEATYEQVVPTEPRTFAQDLCDLINRHSMENHSDTPDFILCEFLLASLKAFDISVRLRERWYGREEPSVQSEQPIAKVSDDGFIGESTPLYQISGPDLDTIESVLTESSDTFSMYEAHHRDKKDRHAGVAKQAGPDVEEMAAPILGDLDEKIERNHAMARRNDRALDIVRAARADRDGPGQAEASASLSQDLPLDAQ